MALYLGTKKVSPINDAGGYKKGYELGKADGIVEGAEQGRQDAYDTFWDTHQQNGNRTNYNYAFSGIAWTDETFKPKYNIVPIQVDRMFAQNRITDLVMLLNDAGVTLDLSKNTVSSYLMIDNYRTQTLPALDMRGRTNVGALLLNCTALHTIEKVILKDDGSQSFSMNSFSGLPALEEIRFEGIIGKNLEIKDSPLLSEASLDSILTHFKDCTGQTSLVLTVHPDVGARLTAYQQSVASTLNVTIVY